jgi:hypothetical protein
VTRSAIPIVSVLAAIGFTLIAANSLAQEMRAPRCGAGVHESEAVGAIAFPQDQIFCPVLADPKEARSFLSLLAGTFRSLDDPSRERTTIASAGLGDSFGLVRWGGPGVPLTFRRRGFSTRLRVYHQSSHLGDEYLLRGDEVDPENLSFEAVEILGSLEMGPLRLYAGGERIFRREPETLPLTVYHGGVELRSGRAGAVQMVSGVDLKTTDLYDWSPAVSGRLGLEVARRGATDHPTRLVMLLLEIYQGPSPYGQFFQDDISYIGVGVHFGL